MNAAFPKTNGKKNSSCPSTQTLMQSPPVAGQHREEAVHHLPVAMPSLKNSQIGLATPVSPSVEGCWFDYLPSDNATTFTQPIPKL